jgi:hypothetical protein
LLTLISLVGLAYSFKEKNHQGGGTEPRAFVK